MGAIANFIINSKTIYTLYKKGQLRCLFDKMTSEMLKRCGFFVFFFKQHTGPGRNKDPRPSA